MQNFPLLYILSCKGLAKDGPRKTPSKNFGRRRKGRPENSWIQEVTTGMRGKGIGDLEWVNREGWRKKINLL